MILKFRGDTLPSGTAVSLSMENISSTMTYNSKTKTGTTVRYKIEGSSLRRSSII